MVDNPETAEHTEKHKQGKSLRSRYLFSSLLHEHLSLTYALTETPLHSTKSRSVKRYADSPMFADQLNKSKQGKGHWKPELASNSEEAVCTPSLLGNFAPQSLWV